MQRIYIWGILNLCEKKDSKGKLICISYLVKNLEWRKSAGSPRRTIYGTGSVQWNDVIHLSLKTLIDQSLKQQTGVSLSFRRKSAFFCLEYERKTVYFRRVLTQNRKHGINRRTEVIFCTRQKPDNVGHRGRNWGSGLQYLGFCDIWGLHYLEFAISEVCNIWSLQYLGFAISWVCNIWSLQYLGFAISGFAMSGFAMSRICNIWGLGPLSHLSSSACLSSPAAVDQNFLLQL